MSFCLIFADYIDRWVALSSFGGVGTALASLASLACSIERARLTLVTCRRTGFVIIGIVLVIFFWYAAKPTKWTPCYGDTTLIVGTSLVRAVSLCFHRLTRSRAPSSDDGRRCRRRLAGRQPLRHWPVVGPRDPAVDRAAELLCLGHHQWFVRLAHARTHRSADTHLARQR